METPFEELLEQQWSNPSNKFLEYITYSTKVMISLYMEKIKKDDDIRKNRYDIPNIKKDVVSYYATYLN